MKEKEGLQKIASDLINFLEIGRREGLLALTDYIKKDTHEVVKVLLILIFEGFEQKIVRKVVNTFIFFSDLTEAEAALIRLFSKYIPEGTNPLSVQGLLKFLFDIDVKPK